MFLITLDILKTLIFECIFPNIRLLSPKDHLLADFSAFVQ